MTGNIPSHVSVFSVCLDVSVWECVLSSLSAYRWCRCTVGGNKCSLWFLWAERPITAGVYSPMKLLWAVHCVCISHTWLSLPGLMGRTEINKNNTTMACIVTLTANKTGNDRGEVKKWQEMEGRIKGVCGDDRTTSLGKTNYWSLVSSNYRSPC